MTQISRAALQTLINSTIYTNLTNDITGDDVNDVCTDINDSSVNWVTDVENTLTNTSTKVPTSAAIAALIGTSAAIKVPQNYSVTLSAADLAAGTIKQILPAVSGYFWSVVDCQAQVNWNTTGFDTTAKIEVSNETAANELYTFDNLDQLLAGSIILRGGYSGAGDVSSGEQFIANTRLVAQCANPPTAGDGTVKIYVTAQLVAA